MIEIALANEHPTFPGADERFEKLVRAILSDAQVIQGNLSIVFLGDDQMHQLNKQYLDHDYTTDVLSFPLDSDRENFSGEVIVCVDEASRQATALGVPLEDELLLYLVHGTLHLVGYLDKSAEDLAAMTDAEKKYLGLVGVTPQSRGTPTADDFDSPEVDAR